jgi:hypothetical protein
MQSETPDNNIISHDKSWQKKPPQGGFVVLENYPHYKIYESGHVVKYKNVKTPKVITLYFLDNYGVVKLFDKAKGLFRPVYMTQLMGEAFHDYDRYKMKLVYEPVNVEFPYHKDNFAIRPHKRMGFRGENNFKNKIDGSKVLEIRKMRADGVSLDTVSRIFGLSKSQISMICSGQRWGWL